MLSHTELRVRSLEHHLRIDAVNQHGWLVASSRRGDRTRTQPSILRAVAARLSNSFGLGTRTERDAARSVA